MQGNKSLDRAERAIRNLEDFFGLSRALDITKDQITRYIVSRQEVPIAPATIAYELAILKRMFTIAIEADKLDRRPNIPHIEIHNVRKAFFDESEFRKVLGFLPEDIQPVVEFCYLTGWRIGEVRPLHWAQIDWNEKTIRLHPGTTKNDEGRVFPFGGLPALESLLLRQRERTRTVERTTSQIVSWVFHRNGRPIKSFYKAWQKACETAGIPGRWVHDFRRSAVRRLEKAGVPRSQAMVLTGHKTESMYRRYAIVSEADLSHAVSKLAVLQEAQAKAAQEVQVSAVIQ